jgi:predicted NBD/HSP70 family sugar kinase
VSAGQRYAVAILRAIEACDVFLIVFSARANVSPHVSNEIENGASSGKPMLLVRTDSTDPHSNKQVSLFLDSYQWFDASAGSLESHIPRMAADVRQLLERGGPTEAGRNPRTVITSQKDLRGGHRVVQSNQKPTLAMGVEVGATKLRGCVVDLDQLDNASLERAEHFEKVNQPANPRTVLDQTKELVGRMLDEQCNGAQPVGIGIAVPGQVDLRAGTLKFGPNLFRARNVPFKSYLASAFPGIPIRIDNEVRCATRCELHVGIGREFDSFVCVFIGAGVGAGTAIDRRVYFGHNFCAGELGHIKIAQTGPPCVCGQIGCLETFVKAQAIVERAEAKATDWESRELQTLLANRDEPLDPESVAEAIEMGDAAAQEVASEVAENLGLGIANYLNLVNPGAVVMGGGLMAGFFLPMIDEITNAVQRNALAEVANTPIVQSAHSNDASMIGAALLFHPDDVWPF